MAQTTILGRIGQLVRANINALLDSAEDPEKMLDQLVRDFTNNIAEAEEAVAQTVGNLRLLEDDQREAAGGAAEWGDKARAASRKADDELRGEGNTAEADRFDGAGQDRDPAPDQLREPGHDLQDQIDAADRADRPAQGRPQQAARQARGAGPEARRAGQPRQDGRRPRARSRRPSANVSASWTRPRELNRFEERIRREEAMARGMQEVAASSLEEQFASLEDADTEVEVEARLAELRTPEGATPA